MRTVTTKEVQKIYKIRGKIMIIRGNWLSNGFLELTTVYDDQLHHFKYMDYSFDEIVEEFRDYVLSEASKIIVNQE